MHGKDKNPQAPKMEHRHFRFIAQTLYALTDSPVPDFAREDVCKTFADALATTNPNFDRTRFLAACGVEE